MKSSKFMLLVTFTFMNLFGLCQPPDGSSALDFTAMDANGDTHTLSDYLAEGKVVILEFSGTACAPCEYYHETKALEHFYSAYGPQGSNEVMILPLITTGEVDYSGAVDELNGELQTTFGSWTEGTHYPVIPDLYGDIHELYDIVGIPTVLIICPDGEGGGTLYESGTLNEFDMETFIDLSCGSLEGKADNGRLEYTESVVCENQLEPVFVLRNVGNNDISSVKIEILEDDVVIETITELIGGGGSIPVFATYTINAPTITCNSSSDYKARLVEVNGVTTEDSYLTEIEMNQIYVEEVCTTPQVEVQITTDNWGEQIIWELLNMSGDVIASGGPFGNSPTVAVQLTVNVNVEAGECYEFIIKDTDNDYGLCTAAPPFGFTCEYEGSYKIVDQNGNILVSGGGFFRNEERGYFKVLASLNIDENSENEITIYPNPTKGTLTINTGAINSGSIEITDVVGKQIVSLPIQSTLSHFDFSAYNTKGIYFVSIKDLNGSLLKVEKVIVQ